MKVRDLLSEREYVFENERDLPIEQQTVWTIKGLPYDTQMKLQGRMEPTMKLPGRALGDKAKWQEAMADSDVEMKIGMGRDNLEFDILKEGLVDVRNLIDQAGNEVLYPKTAGVDRKKEWFARWLPRDIRTELANAISEGTMLSEDDVKN